MTRRALVPADARTPDLPFSTGIRVGNTVQASGQVAVDLASGEFLFPGDVGAQTRRTLENLQAVLAAGEATFDDVVMLRVYLTTGDHFAAMNEAYAQFMAQACSSGVFPCRTTVVVGLPQPDLLIEMDALAVLS